MTMKSMSIFISAPIYKLITKIIIFALKGQTTIIDY